MRHNTMIRPTCVAVLSVFLGVVASGVSQDLEPLDLPALQEVSLDTEDRSNAVAAEIDMALNGINETGTEEPAAEEIDVDMSAAPAVEAVVEEPVALEAVVEEPVALEAVVEEPVALEAVVEEPVALEAVVEESVALEAVVEEPVALETVVEEPIDLGIVEEVIDLDAIEEPIIDLTPVSVDPVVMETMDPASDPFAAPPAAVLSTPAMPRAQPISVGPAAKETVETMIRQQETKRRAFKDHLRDTLSRGDESLQQGWHEDAIGFYEEAMRLIQQIGNRQADRPEKEAAQVGLSEALYRRALRLTDQEDYPLARDFARRAVGQGHEEAIELAKRLGHIIDHPPPPVVPPPQPRWNDEEYLREADTVANFLRLGKEYFVSGELEKSKAMYQTAISRDPENTEAIRMLEKIGNREYDVASKEFAATRRTMMAEVRDGWNRDYQVGIEEKSIWDAWQKTKPQRPIDSDRLMIIEKMRKIKIPEIDFRQANIHDVVDFLQTASVEFDTEDTENDENRGVNIILNLSAGQPAVVEAEPEDPFALAADGGGAKAQGSDISPVTFSARYVSLYEALKIVTDVANLKFRVTGTIVMILRRDAPEDTLIHRRYDVLPTLKQRISEVSPDLGRGRDRRTGDFIELEAESVSGGPTDWKVFFSELGVDWPAGSSINYVPSIGKLIVANTPENLTVFEQILGELNIVPHQIEIESKFVEVAQQDLDALGLEWNLTDDWELAHKEGSGTYPGNTERIQMNKGSFSSGLRYANDVVGVEGGLINDRVMTVASVLTNPELTVIIHALSQSGNTDLLSAPKVTTKSGYEETLKVVKEYIYPTSFEVQGISGNNNNNNNVGGNNQQGRVGGIVEPSDFETREVGVVLSVLPEVSPEGQMINLEMRPEVVGEPEWFNYGSEYTDADGNVQTLNMPQPFFNSRSVQTSILVYNGATVVMGGMITERRTTIDDKIPFLGDIPIIGRLFRSKMEDSEKRNLLIFVTARLVDPAGRPVRRGKTALGDKLAEGALGSATL